MSQFVDYAEIEVIAGKGGAGCVSFRREKYIPRGGPDGGDGGRGGHVFIQARRNYRTLLDYKYKRIFSAGKGAPGRGQNKKGRNGKDLVIPVPVGTVVYDKETREVLADLIEDKQTFRVAAGGRGGKGNAFFATATHRAPKFAQPGEKGERRNLILELKLLADIAFVGFPNAGKSTLIAAVSSARPRIAGYPFTTLTPQLGVVKLDGELDCVVADIPGLIENAHLGKGLGDRFLRHVERSAALILLVDCSPMADQSPETAPEILMHELEAYNTELPRRVMAIVATKTDLAPDPPVIEALQNAARKMGVAFFPISAVTRNGLKPLLNFFKRVMSGRNEA